MVQTDAKLKALKIKNNSLLKLDIFKNKHFECCPYCNCKRYIKYGFFNGIQRYKCKNEKCNKTFSKTTNSIFYHTQKDISLWIKYVELMLEENTLRECADKLNINLSTAFYWRHKLLNSIKNEIEPRELKGDVFVSTGLLHESFNNEIVNSWHNGKRVEIMIAAGDPDSILMVPLDNKNSIYKEFNMKVYPFIDKKSFIKSYDGNIFSGMSKNHNKNLKANSEINDDEVVQHFDSNLRLWIRRFCGVKKVYLKNYLSYFIIFKLKRYFDCLKTAYDLVTNQDFIKTKEMKNYFINLYADNYS